MADTFHTCAIPPGFRLRTASGLVGRHTGWMDPRSGLVGITTDQGEFVMAADGGSCGVHAADDLEPAT